MTKSIVRFVYFIIPLLILLQACSIQEVGIDEISDFHINHIDLEGVSFDIIIPIHNPNQFDFKIKKIKIDVFSDSILLGTAINDHPIVVTKNSSKEYHLPLTVKYASLKHVPLQVIQVFLKRSAQLHLKGFVRVTKGIFWKTIYIDEQKNYQMLRR